MIPDSPIRHTWNTQGWELTLEVTYSPDSSCSWNLQSCNSHPEPNSGAYSQVQGCLQGALSVKGWSAFSFRGHHSAELRKTKHISETPHLTSWFLTSVYLKYPTVFQLTESWLWTSAFICPSVPPCRACQSLQPRYLSGHNRRNEAVCYSLSPPSNGQGTIPGLVSPVLCRAYGREQPHFPWGPWRCLIFTRIQKGKRC
jgi:hypothetical protein